MTLSRYGRADFLLDELGANVSVDSVDAEACLCFDRYPEGMEWEVYKGASYLYAVSKELVASRWLASSAPAPSPTPTPTPILSAPSLAEQERAGQLECGSIAYVPEDVLRELEDVAAGRCQELCTTDAEGLCVGFAHIPGNASSASAPASSGDGDGGVGGDGSGDGDVGSTCILFRKDGSTCKPTEVGVVETAAGVKKRVTTRQAWEPCTSPHLETWYNRVATKACSDSNASFCNTEIKFTATPSNSSTLSSASGSAAANASDGRQTIALSEADMVPFFASNGKSEDMTRGKRLQIDLFFQSSVGIVQVECNGCDATHTKYFYRRYTNIKTFSFYKYVLRTWSSTDYAGMPNAMHVDWDLFSTLEDAASKTNPWQFCNFNDIGVGIPRDCGMSKKTNNNWFSFEEALRDRRTGKDELYFTFSAPRVAVQQEVYTMSRSVEVVKDTTESCRTTCGCAKAADFIDEEELPAALADMKSLKWDRPEGWCEDSEQEVYQEMDCDGDTLPDAVCTSLREACYKSCEAASGLEANRAICRWGCDHWETSGDTDGSTPFMLAVLRSAQDGASSSG